MYEIVSQYLEYLELEKGLSQNTIDAYRRDLYEFADFSGCEIKNIDRTKLSSFIRHIKERSLAPTSIIRKVASLRGFFKWVYSMNIIDKNPASTLEQPKIPQRLPKVISLKEIETMLHSDLKPVQAVIIELLYSCGLRVSELVNLTLTDIDMKSKYVRCFGKGSKEMKQMNFSLTKTTLFSMRSSWRNVTMTPILSPVTYAISRKEILF